MRCVHTLYSYAVFVRCIPALYHALYLFAVFMRCILMHYVHVLYSCAPQWRSPYFLSIRCDAVCVSGTRSQSRAPALTTPTPTRRPSSSSSRLTSTCSWRSSSPRVRPTGSPSTPTVRHDLHCTRVHVLSYCCSCHFSVVCASAICDVIPRKSPGNH